ncbi:unnamed protein product [Prunus armeniaca]
MGFVNTLATPTTHSTSTQYHNISPYAGYTNATYGVCQHAGYSYDMCDLNTISQYLPICRIYQHHVWGLSTRRLLLRHVRPQHNITISPHTPDIPTPRMESVNTPATSTTRATLTQYHISLYTPDIPTPRMGSVNTPATPTTCATSTQYHISPHKLDIPTPRMGSVNTPANPTTRATST